jgi:hypothetical protein
MAIAEIRFSRTGYEFAGVWGFGSAETARSLALLRGEHNDCTVRALAIWAGVSYGEAHGLMATRCARQPRKGAWPHGVLVELGARVKIDQPPTYRSGITGRLPSRMTVGRFARENPRGRFFVLVRGHALAIIDGVIFDWYAKPKRAIVAAWQF